MLKIALHGATSRKSSIDSKLKVEKVVNAPKNPTVKPNFIELLIRLLRNVITFVDVKDGEESPSPQLPPPLPSPSGGTPLPTSPSPDNAPTPADEGTSSSPTQRPPMPRTQSSRRSSHSSQVSSTIYERRPLKFFTGEISQSGTGDLGCTSLIWASFVRDGILFVADYRSARIRKFAAVKISPPTVFRRGPLFFSRFFFLMFHLCVVYIEPMLMLIPSLKK